MGGGDLVSELAVLYENLKKSWHPTTLRNMERVWKAEQKHEAECKKIEELQKELQEERDREDIRHYAEEKGVVKKKADRLDWMYEGPASHVNREEYLLGRNVDKTFELLQQTEAGTVGGDFKTEGDTMPESILKKPSKGGNVTIDLANKIREDPLLVIRKQEEQNRKELLENPVRMKQLREMLQQMKGKKIDKKKKKKKKKNKRRSHSSSSSDDCSADETDRKQRYKRERESKRKDSSSGRIRTLERGQKDRKRRKQTPSPDSYRNQNKSQYRHHKRSQRSSSPRRAIKSEERSQSKPKQNVPSTYRRKDGPKLAPTKRSPERVRDVQNTRILDAAERERRLKEMISNAQWRDEQRDTNMRRHMDEVKMEEEMMEKTGKVDIMTPMLSQAANISTVESRIKSKIYNIQRTKADLEKNFTQR